MDVEGIEKFLCHIKHICDGDDTRRTRNLKPGI